MKLIGKLESLRLNNFASLWFYTLLEMFCLFDHCSGIYSNYIFDFINSLFF